MAKIGDTVRFLNATGGGRITKIDGKVAYVEDSDGFETPVMVKDIVVVLPAGHAGEKPGANIMFDQSAYDMGRKSAEKPASPEKTPVKEKPAPLPEVTTEYGDKLSVTIAFEPTDLKNLGVSKFAAVLVNDSNYYLDFQYLTSADGRSWEVAYKGTVAPNELVDVACYTHETLSGIEAICVQYTAYKTGKPFALKSPGSAVVRPDMTKFYKLHCFRPGRYFDSPVIEVPVVRDDEPVKRSSVAPIKVEETMATDAATVRQLKEKFRVDARKKTQKTAQPSDNPHKLLPLIEVDLHINELTDTTAGMSNGDMVTMQLDEVRKTMKAHNRRIGQKIVFIHGKGEGVLRKEVLALLRREYPKCSLQDASFREYGFGATLVTVK